MPVAPDDWRLASPHEHLRGLTWTWKKYSKYRADWDHDHCAFCREKLAEDEVGDAIHEGYSAQDNYYWLCGECFDDFREMFQFKIASE